MPAQSTVARSTKGNGVPCVRAHNVRTRGRIGPQTVEAVGAGVQWGHTTEAAFWENSNLHETPPPRSPLHCSHVPKRPGAGPRHSRAYAPICPHFWGPHYGNGDALCADPQGLGPHTVGRAGFFVGLCIGGDCDSGWGWGCGGGSEGHTHCWTLFGAASGTGQCCVQNDQSLCP